MSDSRSHLMMEDVAIKIHQAILDHKLAPGMKLGEENLAQLYGVSRTTIRIALQKLEAQGLVTLYPNRGAWVSLPSRKEIEELFHNRRLIEMGIVAELCRLPADQSLALLRQHTEQEQAAAARGDYQALLPLLGEFHIKLAQAVNNPPLFDWFSKLLNQTSLFVATLGESHPDTCRGNEHGELLDLIEAGKMEQAVDNISRHLLEIEQVICQSADRHRQDDHLRRHFLAPGK